MSKKNQEPVEARAWDAVKDKEDPTFFNTAPGHQAELRSRAADVIATGVTINPFEAKVKELHRKDKDEAVADTSPLGTTNAIGEEPPKAKAATAEKSEEKPAAKAAAKEDDKPAAKAKEEAPAAKSDKK
jgi:hypothetical protein